MRKVKIDENGSLKNIACPLLAGKQIKGVNCQSFCAWFSIETATMDNYPKAEKGKSYAFCRGNLIGEISQEDK